MPSDRLLLMFAALLLVGMGLRRLKPGDSGAPVWLLGPALPALAALLTMMLTAWIWGGLSAVPIWHDEAAYLLQTELLATGRLAASPPPVPEAFTQAAVLVTPVLAPKMLPGHALVLLPGIWLGLPGLMPILLAGATAAMIVVLARRIAGASVAALTVALWTSQSGQQRWRASYLSESTTALCWLAGWWCLLRWRDDRRSRWLLLLAAVTGLAAVTRPLTTLAFAIPVGAVVLLDCWRHGKWRQLAGALVLGTSVLAIVPGQNLAVLGNWRASPLALYTRQYMPFDRLGFGLDPTPPELALTPQLDAAVASIRERHAEHIPTALPAVLLDRSRVLARSVFGSWRVVFVPAAVVGLLVLPPAGWLAIATAAALLLLYLPYAHEAHWSAYYVEAMPIPALVVALGAVAILRRLRGGEGVAWWGAIGVAVVALGMAAPEFGWSGRFKRAAQQPARAFQAQLASLSAHRVIVFVRYSDGFDGHQSFVHNVADFTRSRVITAHDLGPPVNNRVRAAFPDRVAYLFDTGSGHLEELGAPE